MTFRNLPTNAVFTCDYDIEQVVMIKVIIQMTIYGQSVIIHGFTRQDAPGIVYSGADEEEYGVGLESQVTIVK